MIKRLLYAGIAVFFLACQAPGEEEIKQTGEEEEYYATTFQLDGEWLDMSREPLTRATENNDLYWMAVFYAPENTESYSCYGQGVFDCLDSMRIKLLKGYQYHFKLTMVKNGKKLFWKDIASGYYMRPIVKYDGIYCDNRFSRRSNFQSDFSTTYARCRMQGEGNKYYEATFVDIERYYGMLKPYIPTENGKISMKLYKMTFGLRIVAEGLKEGDGTLSVRFESGTDDGNISFPLTPSDTIQEWSSRQWPWDMDGTLNAIIGNRKVLSEHNFRVYWTSNDGKVNNKEIAAKSIFLERNKMNIIRIRLTKADKAETKSIETVLPAGPDENVTLWKVSK